MLANKCKFEAGFFLFSTGLSPVPRAARGRRKGLPYPEIRGESCLLAAIVHFPPPTHGHDFTPHPELPESGFQDSENYL